MVNLYYCSVIIGG